MEEDLLKRRMLSNYCFSFLKLDLKEHIYYLRLQKERKRVKKWIKEKMKCGKSGARRNLTLFVYLEIY